MSVTMNLSEYLEKLFNLKFNSTIAELINKEASFVTFPPDYAAIHEGEKSEYLYVILRGIVRGYYIDALGNDISKCFNAENEFFSSEGLRTNSLSLFTIECLEECKCIRLSYDLIRRAMNEDKRFKDFANELYLKELAKLEKRSKDLVVMSAEERYFNFCKEYPNLKDRVPLKYIASYIGIRAASLSRIRKNIKNSI